MDEELARQVAEQLARPSGEGGVQITTAMNDTNAFITARALESLGVGAGERMLEVGPGNGRLSLETVRGLGDKGAYLGFEYEADIARIAQETLSETSATVEVRPGDFMGHAPEAPGYDALLAVNVVYFMDDLAAFATRCREWLSPGGRAVIGQRSMPAMADLPFIEHGFHLRPLDELLRALHRAGLEDVEARFFDEGSTSLGELTVEVDSIIVRAKRPG
jgi:cyclopropane fatty-acyl-phospholipid synthase-like methyltransferase